MKKFRPLNAGYIFTYAVVILCILQGHLDGDRHDPAPERAGFHYGHVGLVGTDTRPLCHYLRLPLLPDRGGNLPTQMRIVRPAQVIPKPGEKRASFIFRQGASDNVLIRRKFELGRLAKYGYIEAFGLKPEDKSGASETSRFFPRA